MFVSVCACVCDSQNNSREPIITVPSNAAVLYTTRVKVSLEEEEEEEDLQDCFQSHIQNIAAQKNNFNLSSATNYLMKDKQINGTCLLVINEITSDAQANSPLFLHVGKAETSRTFSD